MILFTVNDRYVGEAVKRLKAEDIDFELQEVGNGRTNVFSAVVNVSRWCGG